ncbi:MAG: deoxyribodipyrimidine photo-lyase [Candidatus Neomarinimicrobiota bacterium]
MSYLNRVRTLSKSQFSGKAVLYWMVRDKRFNDNWTLYVAQKAAIKYKVPLHVCFQYNPKKSSGTIREYEFLFLGLKETVESLNKHNIKFHLLNGNAKSEIPKLCNSLKVGTILTDYSPLKLYKRRLDQVMNNLDCSIFQVDAHNIIPVWKTSDKKEFAAHTIRRKINRLLDDYLVEIPKTVVHPFGTVKKHDIKWKQVVDNLKVDRTVKSVNWIKPGEISAFKRLGYLKSNMNNYSLDRNNPTLDKLSNLSPFFHYGHISTQRVAYEIKRSKISDKDKDVFLEEMIVRRELADNFCEYESKYDYFEGFHAWAQKTLNEHRHDERDFIYPPGQFEAAETDDPLWNAAQNQMKHYGKMHGYMRMYWAKKILEWSPSPEIALQTAIDLNDKYELDGRDPSGYTGIAWSIGGIHDRAWFERPVYGKIRYMNYNGCKSKFKVKEYIEKYIDL